MSHFRLHSFALLLCVSFAAMASQSSLVSAVVPRLCFIYCCERGGCRRSAERCGRAQARGAAREGEGAAKQAADQGAGAAKGAIGDAKDAAKQAAGQVRFWRFIKKSSEVTRCLMILRRQGLGICEAGLSCRQGRRRRCQGRRQAGGRAGASVLSSESA